MSRWIITRNSNIRHLICQCILKCSSYKVSISHRKKAVCIAQCRPRNNSSNCGLRRRTHNIYSANNLWQNYRTHGKLWVLSKKELVLHILRHRTAGALKRSFDDKWQFGFLWIDQPDNTWFWAQSYLVCAAGSRLVYKWQEPLFRTCL